MHSRHDHEFAAEHLAGFIVIGELSHDPAILAILIPAKPAVRNGFRTQKLETAQKRISLRNLDGLIQQLDFDQSLVGPERLADLSELGILFLRKHDAHKVKTTALGSQRLQ